jgi:hypothetical protein
VLDDSDGRISKGVGFSIGADIAFVAAAGFAALATYSFLEDPMPESTSTFEKPKEFDDPAKGPSARAKREAPRVKVAKKVKRGVEKGLRLSAGSTPLGFGGAVLLGGSF